MLAEVRYIPGKATPYCVFIKPATGWREVGSYLTELSAVASAKELSMMSSLPYTLRFENGVRTNANEV